MQEMTTTKLLADLGVEAPEDLTEEKLIELGEKLNSLERELQTYDAMRQFVRGQADEVISGLNEEEDTIQVLFSTLDGIIPTAFRKKGKLHS